MAVIKILLISILIVPFVRADIGRVRERIYVSLNDNHQCFRILNGTTQVGCQSNREGSSGILHLIEKQSDVDYVLGDPGGHSPFIVAMKLNTFRDVSLLLKLYNSGKLSGILVIQSDVGWDESFSEDKRCPNEDFGLYKNDSTYGHCRKMEWNKDGTGLRFMDFKIPIFFINNETEIDILINKCFYAYNNVSDGKAPKYPLCAVELTMFNAAAGSAVTCIRRNTLISGLDNPTVSCDPIGDYNVFSFIPPTNKSVPFGPDSVIMLAAKMDSLSLFSDYDPGAESAASNVIALLSIVEALKRSSDFIKSSSKQTGRYLMPAFFNGESLDYIGSSRMAWDISNGQFPWHITNSINDQPALLSLDNLALIMEFAQVGLSDTDGYHLYADPISIRDQNVRETVMNASMSLGSYSSGTINPNIDTNLPLPPSSVQSFLSLNRSIPALVITDHKGPFSNRYYNSFADTPVHLNRGAVLPKLINLTDSVVEFLLRWVSNGSMPRHDWRVNATIMEDIMDCLWSWPTTECPIFDRLDSMFGNPVYAAYQFRYKRTYVGPFQGPTRASQMRLFVDYVMTYFLGDRLLMPNETVTCKPSANRTGMIYTYKVMVDLFDNTSYAKYCVISTVNISEALSPAFRIEGYDFTSGVYSTWMESRWDSSLLRVFLRSNPTWETSVFVVGLLVLLVSLVIVALVARGSDVLFSSSEPTPL